MVSLRRRFIQNSVHIKEFSTPLGYVILVSFPLFYFFNVYIVKPSPYESLSLRLIISFFGLLLILWDKLPAFVKNNSPIILNTIIGFSFTFFFSFMYLKNNGTPIWQVNELVGLMLLSYFTDWLTFLLITIISMLLAGTGYFFTTNSPFIPDNIIATFASYSAPIIYFIVFRQINYKIYDKQLNTAHALSATIAHEMRTPLAGINLTAGVLRSNIDTLSQKIPNVTGEDLKKIEKVPDELEETANSALTIIDMLLTNLKMGENQEALERCSMRSSIEEALASLPMSKEDRDLIDIKEISDFTFMGNPTLMKHVWFNLLKNSLHFIRVARKGNIIIWTSEEKGYNYLHFKDTGPGIFKADLPHIFDQFYSKRKYGTGIGLSFCKKVMEELGGQMTCQSVEGEFTEFILCFPSIKS